MNATRRQAQHTSDRKELVLITVAIIVFVANYSFWGWFCQSNICGSLVSLITVGYMLAAFLTGVAFAPFFLTGQSLGKITNIRFFRGQERYCMFCGSRIPRTAKFCNQCGVRQEV